MDDPALIFSDRIPELLRLRAEANPFRTACFHRTGEGSWVATTWQELAREVRQVSGGLSQLGLAPGDRLAILARTCREWQIAELAALSLGAVIVGIDPHAIPDQVEGVLAHSEACGLIIDRQESLERLSPQLRARFKFIIRLDGLASSGPEGNVLSWHALNTRRDPLPPLPEGLPSPDSPATLIYTAGTTGSPKGIEYTHRQILLACQAMLEAFPQIEARDSTLCWLPLAHLFQRMMNLVAIVRGGTTYFLEEPWKVMEAVREAEPSIFVAVPRFYEKVHEEIRKRIDTSSGWRRRLVEQALAAGAQWATCQRTGRLPSWGLRLRHWLLDRVVLAKIRSVMGRRLKFMITGTAPMPPWLLEFFHQIGLLVLEAYGLTENVMPMAANRPHAYRFGSVGLPFSYNELRFEEDGEILVKGPGVFRGYFKESGGADQFTPDGFYRTGDLGRLDEAGFLYLSGRKAEIIKTSTGRRISPVRVETVYCQSPYLDQVLVFGNGRKHLAGLVALNSAAVARALERKGTEPPAGEELARSRVVKDLIERQLDALGQSLAPHERVRAFAILPQPLSVAAGELTPTLKPRRDLIEARYAALLEPLYQDESVFPGGESGREERSAGRGMLR